MFCPSCCGDGFSSENTDGGSCTRTWNNNFCTFLSSLGSWDMAERAWMRVSSIIMRSSLDACTRSTAMGEEEEAGEISSITVMVGVVMISEEEKGGDDLALLAKRCESAHWRRVCPSGTFSTTASAFSPFCQTYQNAAHRQSVK